MPCSPADAQEPVGSTLARAMTPAQPPIELWLVDLVRCASALDEIERATPRRARPGRSAATAEAGRGSPSRTPRGVRHWPGRQPPVGVDLERTRPLDVARRRREEICAAAISVAGASSPHAEPDRALRQAWVRLEALPRARARPGQDLCGRVVRHGLSASVPAADRGAGRHFARQTGPTVADVACRAACKVRRSRPQRPPLPYPRHLPTDRARINGCGPAVVRPPAVRRAERGDGRGRVGRRWARPAETPTVCA